MKKTITHILFVIMILATASSLYSQSVTLKMKRPPLNQLKAADLWSATIINSGETFTAYLYGSMSNNENGEMIATGQTMTFEVRRGTTNFKVSDLLRVPDVNYLSKDPKYKESFINTGGAPPGDYKICVQLRHTDNSVESEDCFDQKIMGGDAPQLISPRDEEEISIENPVFTWMHMKGPGSEQTYTLKIVELKGDESPENAMLKNKVFFEKEGITQTMLQYPFSAEKFEKGKTYAWIVTVISGGRVLTSSLTPYTYKMMITTTPSSSCTCVFNVDAASPYSGLVFSTTATSPTIICTGNSYNLSASPTAYNYQWNLTGASTQTGTGSSFNFTPAISGAYTLTVNSYNGAVTPANLCCQLVLYFNAVSGPGITAPNTIAAPVAVCKGLSSLISLSTAFTPVTDFDFLWLISSGPCSVPSILDPASLTQVSIDPITGVFSVPLSGWMSLTGFNGSTYNTPTSLQQGVYCLSCAIRSHTSCTWVYSTPIQFEVSPPVVGGSLTISPSQFCNDNQPHTFTISLSGYTATSWIWEYQNSTTASVWTPLASSPVFTSSGPVSVTDNVSVSTNYRVTLQSGTCAPVIVSANMTLKEPAPDGFICIKPDIKPAPSPGLFPCVIPYPLCPTTWLPMCYGCDAILTLTDAVGNNYPWTNTLQWDYLEAPYDYTSGTPPQYTQTVLPPTNIINGTWSPTNFLGNTSVNTNRLYTTTWYRAVAHDPSGMCPDKVFYCVALIIKAPTVPVISPSGPIITCAAPVNQTLSLQTPYVPEGLNLQYRWEPGGSWQPFPVLPYIAGNYGSYNLRIRNECGEAVSNSFLIKPEDIPVSLSDIPCCVCQGACMTVTATNIAGLTYNWTCDDPTLVLTPNNTSYQINFCPVKPLTTFTLIVTNPDGCTKKLMFAIKVCPKY